jgi:hypothetical protein
MCPQSRHPIDPTVSTEASGVLVAATTRSLGLPEDNTYGEVSLFRFTGNSMNDARFA